MTVRGRLQSGDIAVLPSVRLTPLLVGTCERDPGQTCTFDPGDDVVGTLGGGRLTEAVLFVHAVSGRPVQVRRATPTYGALPDVTRSGTGPQIELALSSGSPGPLYPYSIMARVEVPGPNGTAQLAIAYDGTTEAETVTIPEEPPAILRGKVDIRLGLSISGLTLAFTSPSSDTLTFSTGTLAAAPAGLKAATATSVSAVTLNAGDLLDAGIAALLAHPRRLTFTTAGATASDAPANVVITGTDASGATQSETLSLAQSAGSSTSTKVYRTITSLA